MTAVEGEEEEEAVATEAGVEKKLRTFFRACLVMVLGERCISLGMSLFLGFSREWKGNFIFWRVGARFGRQKTWFYLG